MAAPRRGTHSTSNPNYLTGNMQSRFQNQSFRASINRPRNQKSCSEINEQEFPQNHGNWTNISNQPLIQNQNNGPRMPYHGPALQNDVGYNPNFGNKFIPQNQNQSSFDRFHETSGFQDEIQDQNIARTNVFFQKGNTFNKPNDGDSPYLNQNQMYMKQSFSNEHPSDMQGNNFSIPPPSVGMGPLPPTMLPSHMSLNRPPLPSDNLVNRVPPPLDLNTNNMPNMMTGQNSVKMPPPMVPMQQCQNSNQHFQPNSFQNIRQSSTSMLHQTQPVQLQHQSSNNHQNFSSQTITPMVLKEDKSGPVHTQDKWLQQFVESRKIRKNKQQQPCQKSMLKICDVHSKMRKMMFLMAELQQQIKKLESCTSCSEKEWMTETNKVNNVRSELNVLKRELQNEDNIKALHVKIESRKRKRYGTDWPTLYLEYIMLLCMAFYRDSILMKRRLKRLRKERYEEKQNEMAEREERTRKIDEWRDKITQKELRQKEEKELKSTADVILNEVRKKLVDANKTIELLHGLQKLRTLRRDRLERQGVITKSDMNKQFETDLEEQLIVMKKQQEIYIAEERALKVMLETEHEETKVKEQEKSRQEHEEDQNRLLFGNEELHSIDESLFPYWHFYHQANLNKKSFIQIRREWDAFLVPETTAGASRIPDWWVGPSQPSNDIWASALKK